MGNLISRSALKADLVASKVELWKIYRSLTHDVDKQICAGQIGTFQEVILRVNDAPAVDAVDVVRCAECRYLKTCNRTIELIPRQAQIGYLRCVVHSCEYGERRDTHDE